MNTQSRPPSGSDDWRLQILAYADGELDPAGRREVEAKLADDPELAELLRDLEQTGPNNREWWGCASVPWPDESTWQRTRNEIAEQVLPRSKRPVGVRVAWVAAALAACLMLGGTVWMMMPQGIDEHASAPTSSDPLAEYEVLPIATEEDVMVSVVRGGIDFASIGHPIPGTISLAGGEDWEMHQPITMEVSQPTPGDTPILTDK